MQEFVDTALILAGGASSRLGRTKALEDLGGKPMVQWVHESLAPLAGQVIVSLAEGPAADSLRSLLPTVAFAVDQRRGRGPIEGIVRGIEAAHGERILVAPCDAPLLRTGLYRLLLESIGAHEAAVPKLEVFDPIRAAYRTGALRRVLAENEDLPSPSSLVDRLDAVFVEEEQLRSVDPRLDSFLDVNEDSDLREVLNRLRSASRAAR